MRHRAVDGSAPAAGGDATTAQLCAASRDRLRRAWGSIEGKRFWLQLQGFDLPERTTQRASVGHSHVLGPELCTFAGMRSVLFKLLATAAMRLRDEGLLAGGMSIAIRFVCMEAGFERHLRFAPLDDTPALRSLVWFCGLGCVAALMVMSALRVGG